VGRWLRLIGSAPSPSLSTTYEAALQYAKAQLAGVSLFREVAAEDLEQHRVYSIASLIPTSGNHELDAQVERCNLAAPLALLGREEINHSVPALRDVS
jgi:hypothetical protein